MEVGTSDLVRFLARAAAQGDSTKEGQEGRYSDAVIQIDDP
jgi:hypothetical protein